MANVKNGAFREIIIDRCLQSRRGYSTQEILEKCNNALERRGEMPVTASNTIRNDILSIENRWNIVVEAVREGRNVRYRYKDPSFSIFNSPLNFWRSICRHEWYPQPFCYCYKDCGW